MAVKMMRDSVIQFSALLSVPLGNDVTVTTYDNFLHKQTYLQFMPSSITQ